MPKTDKDTLTIKYNSKEYEIKKQKEPQTVVPKGQKRAFGVQNADEITVKDYEEKFWNTSCFINDSKVEIRWGSGKYITFIGVPAILLAIGGIFFYITYYRKKKQLSQAEEKSL